MFGVCAVVPVQLEKGDLGVSVLGKHGRSTLR